MKILFAFFLILLDLFSDCYTTGKPLRKSFYLVATVGG
jgi:hypothetical protein